MPEVDLYAPIKKFLVAQGYAVKGEVDDCDVVAVRGDEPPVIVELKERLNLALILQAVDRLKISDTVYIAFRTGKGKSASWNDRNKQVRSLLRRLGLGLLCVSARNKVTAELDPAPYRPRKDRQRGTHLLKEFTERVGDPEQGGSPSRQRLTAYRQDAVRCARQLAGEDQLKLSDLRARTSVSRAGPIVRDNHYGWFERIEKGHYALTPKGQREWLEWADAMPAAGATDESGRSEGA